MVLPAGERTTTSRGARLMSPQQIAVSRQGNGKKEKRTKKGKRP
jgi:hypothetical protein